MKKNSSIILLVVAAIFGYLGFQKIRPTPTTLLPVPTITVILPSETQTPVPMPTEDERIPTKEACEVIKGEWTYPPFGKGPFCNVPMPDEGKYCRDGMECMSGICLSADGRVPGACSKFQVVYGCHIFVKKGKVGNICVD